MDDFKPHPKDVKWIAFIIDLVEDGAIIVYPSTILIYRVRKADKTWVLLNPHVLLIDGPTKRVHERTKLVLKTIGWTAVEASHKGNGHGSNS